MTTDLHQPADDSEPPLALRRAERGFTDQAEIVDVLQRGEVGHLGLVDQAGPYVVPVSYGFAAGRDRITVYLHGAATGRKLAALAGDDRVCFEVMVRHGLHGTAGEVCELGVDYESVMGFGHGRLISDPAERRAGLATIVAHYAPERASETPDPVPEHIALLALDLTAWSGKRLLPAGA